MVRRAGSTTAGSTTSTTPPPEHPTAHSGSPTDGPAADDDHRPSPHDDGANCRLPGPAAAPHQVHTGRVERADASPGLGGGSLGRPLAPRLAVVAAATVAVLGLAGCQGSTGAGSSVASPSVTPSVTPSLSQPTRPYTADERELYREAVRRAESFDAVNQPILAVGRATREAKRLYQRRLYRWHRAFAQLRRYEREGIRVARPPVVLSTEPASVKDFQDNAAEIVLRRCTDQSDLGMTQRGTPVPAEYDEPVIQEVVVSRSENGTWRIDASTTTGEPCSG